VLSRATAEEMTARGPRAQLVEFAGIGHAPVLMDAEQIAPVSAFLRAA
jgi:pimeloyl-ACP methyl ester carboxylesterase